jgi:hypothetical protein
MDNALATVIFEPDELDAALGAMGLKEAVLREAAEYGMRHALQCTGHDPKNLPGIIAWGKSIRFLRDRLVPEGWEPNGASNYATVVAPDKSLAIGAASGDAFTGRHGVNLNPSTRSPKGPVTQDRISVNQQLHFEDIAASFPPAKQIIGLATWLLLYFWDEQLEEIRVELSLPEEMTDAGYVTRWRRRNILRPVPLSSGGIARRNRPDESPDLEIKIERIP